jgi:serine/threonine protein kinase
VIIDSNDLLGQALGTCTLKRLLGRGGMGAVYLAQQSRPRRTVAVKVLLPGLLLEKRPRIEFLARFRREADAIAALDHVHIMPIYEYGEQEDIAYLVMPYVTGGTLRANLEERKILPIGETVTIIEQAAAALDCAHASGIIHRDLKPANILFHADGRILLADFGLAKVLREVKEHDENNKKSTALTSVGTIVGTPEYLSPEQGTGKPIDNRSDIYSLGIVLYQMLTGHVPFSGSSPVAIAIKHAMEPPPPLTLLNPDIPADIEAIVLKAIAKKPEERYSTAREMAQALYDAALQHGIEPIAHSSLKAVGEQLALASSTPPEVTSTPQQDPHITEESDDLSTAPPISGFATDIQSQGSQPPEIDDSDMHNAATEATPLVKYEAPADPPDADAPLLGVVTLANVVHVPQKSPLQEQISPTPPPPTRARRNGWQSLSLMLLGSLLTLVIVVGTVASYLYLAPKTNTTVNKTSRQQASSVSTATTKKLVLPPALIPTGQLLYGTALPGASCDTQHGKWSNTTNAKLICGSNAVTMSNTGNGHLAGTFLDKLPNDRPFPNNYILQVQMSAMPGSQGEFGIFFRNQPGQQQGTYAFLVDATGSWQANTYDNTNGKLQTLVQRPLQGTSSATMTIDIVVQGDTYTFYINGVQQGVAISGQYTSGTIGLAADIGANVSFRNLALYATP